MLKKNKKTIEDIFTEKRERRQKLANLPIEEKVKILIELQKIACQIYSLRGIKKVSWKL